MTPYKKERVHNFLRTFLPALSQAHQYGISHRLTVSSIATTHAHMLEAMDKDEALLVMIVDERIVVDKEALEDSLYTDRFVGFLKDRGIEHIRFLRGITEEELKSFIVMLNAAPTTSTTTLTPMGTFPHIQCGRVGMGFKTGDEESGSGESDQYGINIEEDIAQQYTHYYEAIRMKGINLAADIRDAVRRNKNLPDQAIRQLVIDIIAAIREESSLLLTFFPMRLLEGFTFTHSTNVCILTVAQAMALKMKDEQLQQIGAAAMLHDIGKIYLPEEVLKKPKEDLNDAEMELVRQHPLRGVEYLVDKSDTPPLAMVVAYEHHMLFDGSGYPKMSGNRRQNICSQMTSIADHFDALRAKRFRSDFVETQTITRELANMAGGVLHPVLTKNFLLVLKGLVAEKES